MWSCDKSYNNLLCRSLIKFKDKSQEKKRKKNLQYLILYSPGGGGGGGLLLQLPLYIFPDKSAARIGLAAQFHDFFPPPPLSFHAYFETKLVMSGCTVTKLRNF